MVQGAGITEWLLIRGRLPCREGTGQGDNGGRDQYERLTVPACNNGGPMVSLPASLH